MKILIIDEPPQGGGGGCVGVVLLILLGVGVVAVAQYCWLQLLLSSIASVLVIIPICIKCHKAGIKPIGALFLVFGITWIPTLIITLNQKWRNDTLSQSLEKWIALAGGLVVGVTLSLLVFGLTYGICELILKKTDAAKSTDATTDNTPSNKK